MKQIKLWLATIVALLCSLTASAHDFEVDGIYYTINPTSKPAVVVTYQGSSYDSYTNEYSGEVTIPSTVTYRNNTYSVTRVGNYAFYGCSSLTAIVIVESNTVYDSRNGCNAIIETSSNTLIQGCSTTVIPESVTSIEDYAFFGCSNLTAITLPESVTSIGYGTFYGCSSLTSITLPGSVTEIGTLAFSGCSSLTSITIPESVTSIGDGAFSSCRNLTDINIPEGVTSIGERTFYDCSSLTAINIPESVTSIRYSTFEGCSSLSSITIPKSVKSIESYAFEDCINLFEVINFSDLDIKKGYSSHGNVAYYAKKVVKVDDQIGDYYFYTAEDNTHYLQHYIGKDTVIVLPEDCNGDDYQIGETAFLNNDSITSVEIPQTVGTIGKSAFASCDNLAAVSLARGVMTIEDNAFENCVSLTALSFPESLTAIGEKAFSGCSALSSLSCSANIETYGEGAFEGCTAVETLTVMGSVMPTVPSDKLISITLFSPMPLETTEFANKVYRNATVYVPEGSLERYQAADVWKNFWTIKEFDSTGIEDVTMDVADAPIYNMKGERMACSRKELQKGIYIQNGKKFVVK